ncbi:hypothetical protein D3C80_828740 [compost metagenome]
MQRQLNRLRFLREGVRVEQPLGQVRLPEAAIIVDRALSLLDPQQHTVLQRPRAADRIQQCLSAAELNQRLFGVQRAVQQMNTQLDDFDHVETMRHVDPL